MQQQQVSTLLPGSSFDGFLLVRSSELRSDSKGKTYVDMNLADCSGEINCKRWDEKVTAPPQGSIVWVSGQVQEFKGRIQLKIERMHLRTEIETVDLSLLIPCAPEKPEAMMQEIEQTIASFQSEDLRKLVGRMIAMTREKLLYYPAAMRMHHAEKSGLLHHTTDMLHTAKQILTCYPFLNADILLAGVIVHDLAKTVEMQSDEYGNVSDYTKDGLLVGHLVRGVSLLDEAAREENVSGECVQLLEHMMISHHGIPEYGSPRYPMFLEAEALHWIDLLDARMNEMKTVEDRTPPGAFSEKIMSLDGRRMYHPLYEEITQSKKQ